MAHDKPYRDIEGRPSAVENNDHKGCMHSLSDDKKLTKIPNHRFYTIFFYTAVNEIKKYIKRNNKVKKLIKRRKIRKNGLRNL
jgi:hypothetical protein